MSEIQLPSDFLARMKTLLEAEYDAFLQTYSQPAWQGLRLNPLKVEREAFLQRSPFTLRPVPWCAHGFYYADQERPGKHPYHAAGLYYIQEPSAMAVAAELGVQPGEAVLDLCAAPGGKSTQLAACLQGDGLLVANEIHPARVKALSENIERLGITNALVTNETPERLAARFPTFFDRILVDAPCSGEGMFRKLPEACEDWSEEKVTECHLMQGDILHAAAAMLKPGGMLVYSTCTFAPLENEQSIVDFLDRHPEFELMPLDHAANFSGGEPGWASPQISAIRETARLWPHRLAGEGHFIAKLKKQEAAESEPDRPIRKKKGQAGKDLAAGSGRKEAIAAWRSLADELFPRLAARLDDPQAFTLFGEQLYYLPMPTIDLAGIKVVRAGLHLGTVKKNRFEPSHALALALSADQVCRTANYDALDPDLLRFLKGESLSREGENGWTLVTVNGYSIGWGKQVDGQLKNHYPKGLRWL